jgi:hypothetical protein
VIIMVENVKKYLLKFWGFKTRNTLQHKILHESTQQVYQKVFHGIHFWTFLLNFKPKNFQFSKQNRENCNYNNFQIKLYIGDLTLVAEQHSTVRNVPRILFMDTSYVSSRNFIFCGFKFVMVYVIYNLYFITVKPGCTISGTNED